MATTTATPARRSWRVVDIVVGALLAVAGGVLFWVWSNGVYPPLSVGLTAAYAPLAGLLSGGWVLPAVCVAFLLYAFRDQLARSGVLVIGPNDSFLSYIGDVLPAVRAAGEPPRQPGVDVLGAADLVQHLQHLAVHETAECVRVPRHTGGEERLGSPGVRERRVGRHRGVRVQLAGADALDQSLGQFHG